MRVGSPASSWPSTRLLVELAPTPDAPSAAHAAWQPRVRRARGRPAGGRREEGRRRTRLASGNVRCAGRNSALAFAGPWSDKGQTFLLGRDGERRDRPAIYMDDHLPAARPAPGPGVLRGKALDPELSYAYDCEARTASAAVSMSFRTSSGWETMAMWFVDVSMVVAPIRSSPARLATGHGHTPGPHRRLRQPGQKPRRTPLTESMPASLPSFSRRALLRPRSRR